MDSSNISRYIVYGLIVIGALLVVALVVSIMVKIFANIIFFAVVIGIFIGAFYYLTKNK